MMQHIMINLNRKYSWQFCQAQYSLALTILMSAEVVKLPQQVVKMS